MSKSTQYTKEQLLLAIEQFNNDKIKMAEHLNIGIWSLREQLKKHEINIDKRISACKKRTLSIPNKDELEQLYFQQNMTLLDIGKYYKVSNVTVKKWFVYYDIKLLSHSQTITQKVVPKIITYNNTNYGYDHYFGSDIGKKTVKNTFIEKYGVPWHPIGNESNAELEVLEYFNILVPGFEKKRIYGIELDGFNEELKIAFEYNGLFYHSEKYKGKDLHYKKYKICLDNNIRLFTIFEDEWLNRKNQVTGFIRAALNKNQHKIFARNLYYKEVAGNDYTALMFIENNHIQGMPNKNTCIKHGILIDNENAIYSAMSFSKHPRNNTEIVLSRYCVKNNYTIVGGAQKLFYNIIPTFTSNIKTWSDNRWTQGNLYTKLGFKQVCQLPKDYYYVKNGNRIHKQKMTKKILGCNEFQTEYERAQELGFDRIWDCGKISWVYNL